MIVKITMTATYKIKKKEYLELFGTEDENAILTEMRESFWDDLIFAGEFMASQPDFSLACTKEPE